MAAAIADFDRGLFFQLDDGGANALHAQQGVSFCI